MRELRLEELSQVSGAGGYGRCCDYGGDDDDCGGRPRRRKGNNGFGNGGHDGSPNGKQDETR